MGRVFKYLGDEGVEKRNEEGNDINAFTPGMVELLNFIKKNKNKFDCIIISDSNSVFIDCLEATNFHDVFDKVYKSSSIW